MVAKRSKTVELYDTTLRDGTQAEDISLSVEDKVRIAKALDELGINYIEGGWPGANPRDIDFFKAIGRETFKTARITAFGSTRKAAVSTAKDTNIKSLLKAGVEVATIFGKSSKLHVSRALRVSLEENLEMIFDSVSYLRKRLDRVIYDAEHFFDGYTEDPEYTIKTLLAAEQAGADCLVLCDTNGGVLPPALASIVAEVMRRVHTPVGIHAHNDSDTAVASTIMAVAEGARHVQGTINGFGERAGNADLCSIIPALKLKMGMRCISSEQLRKLRETSRFVYELANLAEKTHQPYVGDSAFAHKGGIHVAAVIKSPETYEHIRPELVGGRQRVLVSDLSGRSNILYKAREYGIDIESKDPRVRRVLKRLKDMENQGYQYEAAEASFELLMRSTGKRKPKKFFKLLGFHVIDEKNEGDKIASAQATVRVEVDNKVEHTVADGNGPVNALDKALRKALERFYPCLEDVRLIDFKVRVLAGLTGTASKVRVLVESGDLDDKWGTVGVSENVIEASWEALVDSLEYKLYREDKKLNKEEKKKKRKKKAR